MGTNPACKSTMDMAYLCLALLYSKVQEYLYSQTSIEELIPCVMESTPFDYHISKMILQYLSLIQAKFKIGTKLIDFYHDDWCSEPFYEVRKKNNGDGKMYNIMYEIFQCDPTMNDDGTVSTTCYQMIQVKVKLVFPCI